MVSCDSTNYGCGGGYIENTWEWLESTGIVTDSCLPYTSGEGVESACRTTCVDGSDLKRYKCKSGSVVHPIAVAEIKSEIYQHGPVEGAFTVYDDFLNYKSGIYHHISGSLAGGHAIKILGWGYDETFKLNYWICANSWGTAWGENGFFRIKQGECGINE